MQSNNTNHWQCPNCNESIDSNFHTCFACGSSREGELDPSFIPAVVPVFGMQYCKQCLYSLKGLQGSTCPECGTSFDPTFVDTPQAGLLPSLKGEQGFEHRLLHFTIWCWLAMGTVMFFMAIMPAGQSNHSILFTFLLFASIATTLGLIIFSADESDAIKPPSKDAPDPLCPHCLTSIGPFEHFCRQCDGPITCHAATDPIGQIFSLGHLCRRATTSCTRLSTLIGMWLIFGSGLITLIFYPVISLENEESFAFFFLLLISILIPLLVAVIHIAILWQVTHRYIEHRKSRAT